MLTPRFTELFPRLVQVFKRYHDVPRGPDTVVALASARIDLDTVRNAIAVERERINGRRAENPIARQTSVSEDDLARLRTFGSGFVSG